MFLGSYKLAFQSEICVLSKYYLFSLLLLLGLAVALHWVLVNTSLFLGKPGPQLREFCASYFPLNLKKTQANNYLWSTKDVTSHGRKSGEIKM